MKSDALVRDIATIFPDLISIDIDDDRQIFTIFVKSDEAFVDEVDLERLLDKFNDFTQSEDKSYTFNIFAQTEFHIEFLFRKFIKRM